MAVKNIKNSLAVATCSLLSLPSSNSNGAFLGTTEFESGVLYYSESDLVTIIEPVTSLRQEVGDDKYVNFLFTYDAMSGATPSGAVPNSTAQTFSNASGVTTTIPAGNLPTMDFTDKRVAISGSFESLIVRNLKSVIGTSFSVETDYTAIGVNTVFEKEVFNKRTTISAGASYSFDKVRPGGGAPIGLSLAPLKALPLLEEDDDDDFNENSTKNNKESEAELFEDIFSGETKTLSDFLLGATHIMSRRSLIQVNYGIGSSNGYLTDPYKLYSVVDNNGNVVNTRHEKRPDSRLRQTVYSQFVAQFPYSHVMRLSYRYFWDDWGIHSHTVDLKFRLELHKNHYVQPHVRFYQQSNANFYRHSVLDAANQDLVNVSADFRLGQFSSYTLGIKYGLPINDQSELALRVEKMVRTGDSHPADAVGIQTQLDLFPDLNAIMVSLNLSLEL